jgi:diguanylate cyclase (GGDEF)-like protein
VAVATELAYPIGDLLMAALVVGVIALHGWRVNRMWGLLAAGFLLLAIADCLYAVQIAHGAANPSPMTNFAYVFAVAVLAIAAWQTDDQVQAARLERWSMLTLPACFALTALGLLIYDHWHRLDDLALSFSIITLLAAIGRMAFTFRDISGLAEARLQAKTDDLTGLPNRRAFVQRTAGAIRAARLASGSISVMLLDLDGFKELNDTLGHPAGDELLALVGPRVQRALRETDLVARIGGDEFAVILDPDPDPAATGRVAQKILDAFRDPFEVDGVALRVTASIGIARFPADADDADDLIKRADVAMYLAKSARSGYALYASGRDTHSRARLALAGDLEAALQNGAIEAHFQLKATTISRQIVGVEALARWRQADGSLVPPNRFIDAAERAGLARALTTRVLDLALTQIAIWRAAGHPISVSVNTTVPDLLDTEFPRHVSEMLAAHGLPPDALILEVTERSVLSDPVRIGGILARLDELGVGLSLDDFGTGFSSLAHLRTLPVTEVKVDRSFVSGLNTDPRDRAIVDAIIRLAHELEMRVVAEGIEDQQTWDTLAGLGCDLIQGYALSRPAPAGEVERQLDAALQRPSGQLADLVP